MDVKISELVAAARQGDKNAFARLYELTLQSAYYLALRMLKNEQDVSLFEKLVFMNQRNR